jgi:hypothetical protein
MENDKNTNPFELVKPPLFKKGSLTFSLSGHYLRESDRHYRCDLSCRGGCDKKEPQIKKEDMERNFSRYAQKFVLPTSEKTFKFADDLMKKLFYGIVDGEDWEDVAQKEEYIYKVIDAMKADVKESQPISESDINEIQNPFININSIDNRTLLNVTLLSVFKSISEPEGQNYLARDIANICQKIYISDTGRIQSVLFEKWGWYILNHVNKSFPEYFGILEKNNVKILNKKDDPMLKLDLKEAVMQFDKNNFKEALHSEPVSIFYTLFSVIKSVIDPIIKRESNEKQKESVIKVMGFMMSPQFQMMARVIQVGNAKIRRKRSKKNELI